MRYLFIIYSLDIDLFTPLFIFMLMNSIYLTHFLIFRNFKSCGIRSTEISNRPHTANVSPDFTALTIV